MVVKYLEKDLVELVDNDGDDMYLDAREFPCEDSICQVGGINITREDALAIIHFLHERI